MVKKKSGVSERKKQQKSLKKRAKDKVRRKRTVGVALSENAIQHKMISEFGNIKNFVRNMQALSEMMDKDEDLKTLRFNPEKAYEKMDLAKERNALADLYSTEGFAAYAEEYEAFWKEKRKEILPDLVTDEFVENADKIFKKLMVTKKGFKKEYRAVLAGKLLVDSHKAALAESSIEENSLWELIFNATLKENKKELPPEQEKPEGESEPAPEAPAAEKPTEG